MMGVFRRLKETVVPFDLIERHIPRSGVIVDAGGGTGIVGIDLAQRRPARSVMVVDLNTRRLRFGLNRQEHGAKMLFVQGDILRLPVDGCDAVILSDVLHHIPWHLHRRVIKALCSALRQGGVFVTKEIDRKMGLRCFMSAIADLVLYPGSRICYRTAAEIAEMMRGEGLTVKIEPVRSLYGSVTLIVGEKPAALGEPRDGD